MVGKLRTKEGRKPEREINEDGRTEGERDLPRNAHENEAIAPVNAVWFPWKQSPSAAGMKHRHHIKAS